ncbi:hypothetical protein FisN_2Lh204 [Fistulifera solaris]|uniref:Uncharacterized protein n=1 Tax=Fistulifera solaris TaxID=1519565 RepID=A0A1Z5KFE4_FISSO|nr:hypothetical protein FisN_2Lh204 [Fistulifera solaris]|eukprot:GAX24926.1 hypothetical protein FisN_2Lh204 [Fistulifera solaris]
MMSLNVLTSQLARMSLKSTSLTRSAAIKSIHVPQMATNNSLQQRLFGARNKPSKKDEKRMRKIVSLETQQQKDWIDVQQSLSIGTFPGKAVASARATKKAKQNAVEAAAERQRLTKAGGGLYPPLRYSPEETELLLKEAYEAVPERAGKRGTRQAKRQGRRWQAVRKIRKKYKKLLVRAHYRKMEKRSLKVAQVKAVLAEAPDIVKRDREYQAEVFRRWAQTMLQSADKNQERTIVSAAGKNLS